MPTARPRITITLTERQHELLRSISANSGQSMSSFVTEMLDTGMPMLERMAATMQAIARNHQEQRDRVRQQLDEAQSEMEPLLASLMGQFDLFLATAEQASGPRAEAGASPAPATARRSRSPHTNRGVTPPPRNPSKPKPGKASGQVRSRSRKGS